MALLQRLNVQIDQWLLPISSRLPISPWIAGLVPVFVFLVLRKAFERSSRNPRGLPLPPGPAGLPLVGNLFQIPQVHPWIVYDQWAPKYGDLTYLEVFGQSLVIINNQNAIVDILEKDSANTSDRLWLPAWSIMELGWAFPIMSYTSWWRVHRKTFHQLLGLNQLAAYRPIIQDETAKYLRRLSSNPDGILQETRAWLGQTIMRVSYGVNDAEYNADLVKEAHAVNQGFSASGVPGRFMVNYFPWLQYMPSWFPGTGWKVELAEIAAASRRMVEQPFADAMKRIGSDTRDEYPNVSRTLIEGLPAESHPDYSEQATIAKNIAAVSYIAGADTSLSGAYAIILALAMHPEVARQGQNEIDSVVGTERLPRPEDCEQLPYIQAIVKEAARWHTIGPLSLPHMSKEDAEYNGYFLPKGTLFMPNVWGVMHDPKRFEDPLAFKPERYMKNGQINKDVLDPGAGAFGYGRRICPGRYLSTEVLTFLTASLLSAFDVKPAKDRNGNYIPLKLEVGSETIWSVPSNHDCSTPSFTIHNFSHTARQHLSSVMFKSVLKSTGLF
ncbi:cytochrome P450 [Coprinopsis marcescibilis]|uniref:Cytochrome P450 n=1 Tax=Coprinopsis marcescibilis TaxID=230819 RepID=A0A5C3KIN2_COPMA|nr:cytochrome P450 [Coprinopsis marcescibilis]